MGKITIELKINTFGKMKHPRIIGFSTYFILQNRYLRIYEGSFGANELKDDCAHSASNEKLLKVKIVKNQTLCYYTGQLCRPMSIFLSIISKVTST